MSLFCVQRDGRTKEINKPEDVIPYLAGRKRHWKKGYSAYELAHSWVNAGGIPAKVRSVLDACPDYKGAELVQGLFEHSVDVPGKGRASQTDLLAVVKLANGNHAAIAVEGKADEGFDKFVSQWQNNKQFSKRKNRDVRLKGVCEYLDLEVAKVQGIRYQLLHRTYSAIYAARQCKEYEAPQAVMLVHCFSENDPKKDTSFKDFQAFAEVMGIPVKEVNKMSKKRNYGDIQLRLGWVRDEMR